MAEDENGRVLLVNPDGTRRPDPDPTVLTTQALAREVAGLKELMFRELESLKSTIDTRFTGMDVATTLLRERQEKVPSETDKAIQHLRELMDEKVGSIEKRFSERDIRFGLASDDVQARTNERTSSQEVAMRNLRELMEEKFRGVDKQFVERDTRTEQTSRDSKVAVDAALQAAKEAVGEQNKSNATAIAKSEAATIKQMDQIGTLIATTTKNADEKIDDLKSRVSLIEGRTAGIDKTEHQGSQSNQNLIGIGGIIVAIVAIIAAVIWRQPPQVIYPGGQPYSQGQQYIPPVGPPNAIAVVPMGPKP